MKTGNFTSGNNDFENGLDLYMNTATGDDFDWVIGSSGSRDVLDATLQFSDHTRRSSDGHFAAVLASGQSPNSRAQLFTPQIAIGNYACVSFYVYNYAGSIGTLNVYGFDPSGNRTTLEWSLSTLASRWAWSRVGISTSNSTMQVIFEYVIGTSTSGVVAIDDVIISSSYCSAIPSSAGQGSVTVTPFPSVSTTNAPVPSVLNCNFESSCVWTQSTQNQFNWTIVSVSSIRDSGIYKPYTDHTQSSAFFFLPNGSFVWNLPFDKTF
ncbi:MAM and LDL-receptor class A domain-containing protein 1-like [Aplysia californica]|uniref:MAM and LDL-receptor class A domain-containing protein 1-like n=1 Tax=Aplysia californica TaxID=6500 RepID=A0ABM1VYX3_APLCA|nr:MAM and LDL-receptor class A domain-containing protein 1-like [Aplysia californica]